MAVLEARDRVGGRILNVPINRKEVVEIGGQWVGPTQDRVLRLIGQLGLETFPTYVDGENVYYRSGQRQTYTGTIPPASRSRARRGRSTSSARSTRWHRRCRPRLRGTLRARPSGMRRRSRRGSSTTRARTRRAISSTCRSRRSLPPSQETSRSWACSSTFASAGGFNRLIDTAGGAQESRIVGGSQLIAIRMAKKLGDRVVLKAPVHEIQPGQGRGPNRARHAASGARSVRSSPCPRRSRAASSTRRSCPARAISSRSECRWGRWSSAWPSTTSRSGAPTGSAGWRRATRAP